MEIIETITGRKMPVVVRQVENKDFKILTKNRYSFDWKKARNAAVIYKLYIKNEQAILGVIALIDVPGDKRIEIKLLASSIDNIGQNKLYDRIAGCLIAFACQLSADLYGLDACVSLVPKTELVAHYMEKYYMLHGGNQLYVEGPLLKKIINEYYV